MSMHGSEGVGIPGAAAAGGLHRGADDEAAPQTQGDTAPAPDDDALSDGPRDTEGVPVGASDADADAARSGADVDLGDATRDTQGVLFGA